MHIAYSITYYQLHFITIQQQNQLQTLLKHNSHNSRDQFRALYITESELTPIRHV